jgi:hypothetical protein
MNTRSLAEIPEHDLVPLILRHSALRGMVLAAAGAHGADKMYFRVPAAALSGHADEVGDVDALVYTSGAAQLAAAYEFKRVKIMPHTFETVMPNKLGEFSKAVHQANSLARIGFSRVVLAILLVTDGRERSEFNFAFRGATTELLRRVDSAFDLSELHPDVGVFRIEIVQPMDKDVTLAGGISGKAFRIPTLRNQPIDLTNRIERYVSQFAGA